MLRRMILDSRSARRFAGQVTAEMIRLGADGGVMRRNNVPTGTFHWVFGSRAWTDRTPRDAAEYLLSIYNSRCIFRHNAGGMARELAAQDADNSNDLNG